MVTTNNKYDDLIYYNEDAQSKLKSGIDKIVNAVKVTLGPFGRNVIFAGEDGAPIITKDGVSVSNYIRLIDPIENMAADILKQASRKTVEDVGDGTTTSMVLTQALINNTPNDVININLYKRYLELYAEQVIQYLEDNKTIISLTDESIIHKILITSANQDKEIADNLLKAFKFTGLDGLINISLSRNNKTNVELDSGYRLNRGWLSSYFINKPEEATTVLKDCYVLLLRDRLESFKSVIPLLKTSHEEKKPLIIVAKDFSDDVIATCAKNFSMGTFVVPLYAEGFNDDVVRNLEDLALYCDGNVFTEAELKSGSSNKVGIIDEIIIKKDFSTIKSSINVEAVVSRVAQLKQLLSQSENEADKKRIKERISKLTTGVATIKVGGYTESEIKERFDRYEDALGSMKAAVSNGILPGGGTALYRAALELKKVDSNVDEKSQALDCLVKSLVAPYTEILKNADLPTHKMKNVNFNTGYNLHSTKETDFIKDGIIDPFLVTSSALRNAVSIAIMITTTGCVAKNTETILL